MNLRRVEYLGGCVDLREQKRSRVEQGKGLWLLGPCRGQQRAKEQHLTPRKGFPEIADGKGHKPEWENNSSDTKTQGHIIVRCHGINSGTLNVAGMYEEARKHKRLPQWIQNNLGGVLGRYSFI